MQWIFSITSRERHNSSNKWILVLNPILTNLPKSVIFPDECSNFWFAKGYCVCEVLDCNFFDTAKAAPTCHQNDLLESLRHVEGSNMLSTMQLNGMGSPPHHSLIPLKPRCYRVYAISNASQILYILSVIKGEQKPRCIFSGSANLRCS